MAEPKYPQITAKLIGENANIYNLIGLCNREMRRGGIPSEERKRFFNEVTKAENYDKALIVMMEWINIA